MSDYVLGLLILGWVWWAVTTIANREVYPGGRAAFEAKYKVPVKSAAAQDESKDS
jgi:hypothetical protein